MDRRLRKASDMAKEHHRFLGSRYYGAISNIPELLKLYDILHIYNNTENFYRIVRKQESGNSDSYFCV